MPPTAVATHPPDQHGRGFSARTTASGDEPWKYYDLGEGYCSYDFFAKCPHRRACAHCDFYIPKDSSRGQLLAVKNGIQQMLEQLSLTDEEKEALEGDRDAVTALLERLADIPSPTGLTPKEIGSHPAFIPLSALTGLTGPSQHREDVWPSSAHWHYPGIVSVH